MPNIKSAKKRVKIIRTKTLKNQMIKSAIKTYLKKFEAALRSGDSDLIKSAYTDAVKKLDQAVSKGVIHKNTAARKKSSLALKVNKLGA